MLCSLFLGEISVEAAKKPKLNKKKVTLKVGKSIKLKVSNTKKKIKWRSNKKTVATVNSKGKVIAKAVGKAKITARFGKKKLVCKVTVKKETKKTVTKSSTSNVANTSQGSTTNVENAGQTIVPGEQNGGNSEVPVQPTNTPNGSDREILQRILAQQAAMGVDVEDHLDFEDENRYKWDENGNVIEIYWGTWETTAFRGEMSFVGLKHLKKLIVDSNRMAEEGVKIDVSGCENLEWLTCSFSNLEELDVSGCVSMDQIGIQGTRVKNIDISDCTELRTIACHTSNLEKLDISNCPKMENIYGYDMRLTEFIAGNNKMLRTLELGGNNLTQLDISECNHLDYLSCRNNNLTKLDLSNCICLTEVYCSGNQLTELKISDKNLDGILEVDKGVPLDDYFGPVHLYDGNDNMVDSVMNEEQVAALQEIIEEQKKMSENETEFPDLENFSNRNMYVWNAKGDLVGINWGAKNLQGDISFASLEKLRYLECAENSFNSIDLSKNKELIELDISYSFQNNPEAIDISHLTNLKTLNCSGNGMKTLDVSNYPNLKTLYCHSNQLTELNISGNSELQNLDCRYNQLNTLDVSSCLKMIELDCSRNDISELDITSWEKIEGYMSRYERTITVDDDVTVVGTPKEIEVIVLTESW